MDEFKGRRQELLGRIEARCERITSFEDKPAFGTAGFVRGVYVAKRAVFAPLERSAAALARRAVEQERARPQLPDFVRGAKQITWHRHDAYSARRYRAADWVPMGPANDGPRDPREPLNGADIRFREVERQDHWGRTQLMVEVRARELLGFAKAPPRSQLAWRVMSGSRFVTHVLREEDELRLKGLAVVVDAPCRVYQASPRRARTRMEDRLPQVVIPDLPTPGVFLVV